MKKIIIASILSLQLFFITACVSSESYEVTIHNVTDKQYEINDTVDLNQNITAWQLKSDEEKAVNVTSKIEVEIVDTKNNEDFNELLTDENRIYKVTYFVIDPTEKRHEQSCLITVGRVETDYNRDDITYDLVWADEFDGTSLNTDNWKYEIGTGSGGWGNSELQYYTNKEENVSVNNGTLKINAINENFNGSSYTSGRLITQGKQSFKYGKFEVSAKVPSARGSWSAFWLLAENNSWPATGEIDIMEHVGNVPGEFHANNHTSRNNGGSLNGTGGKIDIDNFETSFVTYGVEWLPDRMDYYVIVDGIETVYHSYIPSDLNNGGAPTYDIWPFYEEFFLILNVAVGGNWGGAGGVTSSDFPCTMEVDYVRVYQSPELNEMMGVSHEIFR